METTPGAHGHTTALDSASARLPEPKGPGSVSGAPDLPAGFSRTFTSRYVDAGGLRLHAVIGGKGRPLLLLHGWPQTWYQWRLVMPELARDFQVIAVDQRGIGLSDKTSSCSLRTRTPCAAASGGTGRSKVRAHKTSSG